MDLNHRYKKLTAKRTTTETAVQIIRSTKIGTNKFHIRNNLFNIGTFRSLTCSALSSIEKILWRTCSCSRTFKRSNEGFFLPRNPNLKFQSHERLYELSPNEHNADGYQGFYGDGFTGHGHPGHLNNNPSSKQPANIPDYDYFVNQSNPEVFL